MTGRGVKAAIEIAPQPTESYAALAAAGACGLTLFQETYDEGRYACYHPRGTKASYDWRLTAPERAAEAGIRRLGLGFLLGLADPPQDLLAMARHAAYLQDRFPGCALAFSLPRIRKAPAEFVPPYSVDDDLLVRMYAALRLAFPEATLVLSTRECPELREPAGADLHHADECAAARLPRAVTGRTEPPHPGGNSSRCATAVCRRSWPTGCGARVLTWAGSRQGGSSKPQANYLARGAGAAGTGASTTAAAASGERTANVTSPASTNRTKDT